MTWHNKVSRDRTPKPRTPREKWDDMLTDLGKRLAQASTPSGMKQAKREEELLKELEGF